MTTTFFLPNTTAAMARNLFGSWRCRVEQVEYMKSCNIVFFDEDEWKRFEQYADDKNIEYEMV